MLNICNKQNCDLKNPYIGSKKNAKKTNKKLFITQNDNISFCTKKDDSKVTLLEGVKLIAHGAGNKIKEIVLSLIKHPIAAIITGAATTAVLLMLPLVGISSAAAAGALGIGCALLSAFDMIKNIKNAAISRKEHDNIKLRNNLQAIGGSLIDTAISARFLKSNFKYVKYQLKYGKIGLQTDAIRSFKEAKGFKNKLNSLTKSNGTLTEGFNKYAGIDELQKELKFSNDVKKKYIELYDIKDDEEFIKKAYDRLVRDLHYKSSRKNYAPTLIFNTSPNANIGGYYGIGNNSIAINPKNTMALGKLKALKLIRHELQHFQQMIDIERAEGLGLNKYYLADKKAHYRRTIEILNELGFDTNSEMVRLYKKPEYTFEACPKKKWENGNYYELNDELIYQLMDEKQRFAKHYNIRQLAKQQGRIKKGTKAHKISSKYFNDYVYYTKPNEMPVGIAVIPDKNMPFYKRFKQSIFNAKCRFVNDIKSTWDSLKYSRNSTELDAEIKASTFNPIEDSSIICNKKNLYTMYYLTNKLNSAKIDDLDN